MISSPVLAQETISDKDFKISKKEEAVLLFFRLAGASPDYEKWIKEGDVYKNLTDDKQKEKFLISETLRLGQGYSSYDPGKGLLEFETSVIASYKPPQNGKPATFHFKFPEQSEDYIPVFSYPYGKNSISLIVNKFAEFSTLPLTEAQYKKVLSIMPYQDEEYTAKLTLQVRPVRADIDKPIVNKDVYQWLMLGDIAFMRCQIIHPTTMQMTKLWEYIAPWYEKEYNEKYMNDEQKYPSPFDLFKDKKD